MRSTLYHERVFMFSPCKVVEKLSQLPNLGFSGNRTNFVLVFT